MDAARLNEDLQDAGRVVQENLASGIGRMQEEMEERVRRGYDQTRDAMGSLNAHFEGFVRESPLIAIAGAFAAGYLLAKLTRALT
jgi:ElaB/YqjD/DUF883 family membrane-anchored ribosome-binding protein